MNWSLVPSHIQPGLQDYIEYGIPPGSFLEAVITNNLLESFARADEINAKRVGDIVKFMYQFAPLECWGSREAMEKWIKDGGLRGKGIAVEGRGDGGL